VSAGSVDISRLNCRGFQTSSPKQNKIPVIKDINTHIHDVNILSFSQYLIGNFFLCKTQNSEAVKAYIFNS
jgi:hypothetical protein